MQEVLIRLWILLAWVYFLPKSRDFPRDISQFFCVPYSLELSPWPRGQNASLVSNPVLFYFTKAKHRGFFSHRAFISCSKIEERLSLWFLLRLSFNDMVTSFHGFCIDDNFIVLLFIYFISPWLKDILCFPHPFTAIVFIDSNHLFQPPNSLNSHPSLSVATHPSQ